MKKLLSIALLSTLGFSSGLIMPYGSYIKYSNSALKDKGVDVGLYTSVFKFPFKFELGGEFINISYKNNILDDYSEKDITFISNFFIQNNYKFKLGIRNIYVDQNGNNDKYDKVLISGILYYEYLKYNFGLDYYYSIYDGFNVRQITPHFGVNFGNYSSEIGSFYLNININIINISNKVNANTANNNYSDIEASLTNYIGSWATTLEISAGKNAYKVAKNGFVVYNLGEEYKYSYGLSISYNINKYNSLKVGFNRSKFKENGLNAYSNVYVASYSISF